MSLGGLFATGAKRAGSRSGAQVVANLVGLAGEELEYRSCNGCGTDRFLSLDAIPISLSLSLFIIKKRSFRLLPIASSLYYNRILRTLFCRANLLHADSQPTRLLLLLALFSSWLLLLLLLFSSCALADQVSRRFSFFFVSSLPAQHRAMLSSPFMVAR